MSYHGPRPVENMRPGVMPRRHLSANALGLLAGGGWAVAVVCLLTHVV